MNMGPKARSTLSFCLLLRETVKSLFSSSHEKTSFLLVLPHANKGGESESPIICIS